ncbi:TPA: hypothetical protein ACSG6Q_003622 [Escherichia coli]
MTIDKNWLNRSNLA